MSFHQKIQYHALHHMYGTDGNKIIDSMLASDPSIAEKNKLRNVCALIHSELFDRLENMCSFLDISKREFIEYALIEALNLANKITEEVALDAHYEALAEFQAAESERKKV